MLRSTSSGLHSMVQMCLNRQFNELLAEARHYPIEQFNKHFLQLYLGQVTRYAHWPSVAFLWNKFVQKRRLLVVKPNVLADIAHLSLHENKVGFVRSVLQHYNSYYSHEGGPEWDFYKYSILNVHIEMYAKKNAANTPFKLKWHAFVTEVDNVLITYPVSVWDWPNLTESLRHVPTERMVKWLFNDCKQGVLNDHSIPMLLNMILLQTHVTPSEKAVIFEEFLDRTSCNPSKCLQESIQILVHEFPPNLIPDLLQTVKSRGMKFTEKTDRAIISALNKNYTLE